MSTEFLEKQAIELQRLAASTAERSATEPANFWLDVAAKNQAQAARDAVRALELEYAREVGERIDLHFTGPTSNGAVSLDAFLRIVEPLNKAWKAAAFHLRHGIVQGRIGSDIGNTLNLRLAGIAAGSTHIIVMGNGAADLAGENLFRDTLAQTFRLLASTNGDFYEAVDAMGGRAAQHVKEAMHAIDGAGLAAQFRWQDRADLHTWHGSTDEIARICSLLASASHPVVYEETISGIVSGIFENGKIDLRTDAGKVRIRFPLELIPYVQTLQIASTASIRVQSTKFVDPVLKNEFVNYQMIAGLTR